MAITTLDGYVGASKQILTWMKTGTRTCVAALPYTTFDIAGNPGAGTLAIGNTANGVVPTDATAGYPTIGSFSGGSGYLSQVQFGSSIACRLQLFDRLFSAGAYAYNADTTLASQPAYSGRVPGTNYTGLQLWIEGVTAFTGTLGCRIDYLDEDGNAGDTGVVATAAFPVGRCFQMPLAAGDSGVSQITRVRGSTASAGTFNVSVLRPLWMGTVWATNSGDTNDLLKTGFVQLYEDSALYMLLYPVSTAVGLPTVTMQIAMG